MFNGQPAIFRLWADSGSFRTIQKGRGLLRPRPFWMLLKLPEAARTLKMAGCPLTKMIFLIPPVLYPSRSSRIMVHASCWWLPRVALGEPGSPRRPPPLTGTWFLANRKSSIWEIWAAPGGRQAHQKGGGLRPPHLFGGFPGRWGPPRFPTSTISGWPNNHVIKTEV